MPIHSLEIIFIPGDTSELLFYRFSTSHLPFDRTP
jgi:hypothetical protein